MIGGLSRSPYYEYEQGWPEMRGVGCAIYGTNLLLLLDFWNGIKGNFSVAVLGTKAKL